MDPEEIKMATYNNNLSAREMVNLALQAIWDDLLALAEGPVEARALADLAERLGQMAAGAPSGQLSPPEHTLFADCFKVSLVFERISCAVWLMSAFPEHHGIFPHGHHPHRRTNMGARSQPVSDRVSRMLEGDSQARLPDVHSARALRGR